MENTRVIDGVMFSEMLRAGTANLKNHAKEINDLNVFPIPDGDTGDNMTLTMMGGISSANNQTEKLSCAARRAADGMLLSARGNSGVILSQLFDGIAEGFSGADSADVSVLAKAMKIGVCRAYGAVMEPTEGTMLTVAKSAAEYASNTETETVEEFFRNYISAASDTLKKTPEMLPVLKKAGVVDSGGAGLIYIFDGMRKALGGENIYGGETMFESEKAEETDTDLFTEDSVLEYGYCTEVLLRLQRIKTDPETFDVKTITDYLGSVGNSVVAVKSGTAVKIHVHTETPDKVLGFCRKYGEFLKVKIENMSLQHENSVFSENSDIKGAVPRKKYGIVSVCSGDGIKELFYDRGADVIVDGGQKMNPSAEEFIGAFEKINAETIFVLPNNKNVILAARQAAGLYKKADVRVIESKTVGDGYASLSMFNPDGNDPDRAEADLKSAMEGVLTAEISQSIKDADSDGFKIKTGDYIGFSGKRIFAAEKSRFDAACKTVDKLNFSDYDICILIKGAASNAEEAEKIKAYTEKEYPGKEVYIIDGMQEIYDYIFIFE